MLKSSLSTFTSTKNAPVLQNYEERQDKFSRNVVPYFNMKKCMINEYRRAVKWVDF